MAAKDGVSFVGETESSRHDPRVRPHVEDWSEEFPGLRATTYLDSCAHGLLPRRARRAIEAHLDRWEREPSWAAWGEAVGRARRAFARLVNAREDEVAVQANATSGVAALMNALPAGAQRDRLVTLDMDFPTAPAVAERQRARGFRHEHLRGRAFARAGEWARALDGRTALACVPAVASFSGHRLDVGAFAREAHAHGVPLLVDAFQAAGTYPLDVRALDVDFLVTGVYKWLMAPAGLAFLYVKREHHERLQPTTSGWYALREPSSFDPLGPLAPDARRFEYGGPSVVACVAVAESIGLLLDVGLANVQARQARLVERVMEHARARKLEVLTPEAPEERAGIVTFRVPDLQRALDACAREKVMVNPRLGGIRASPHFYNEARDVDRLFEVLDAAA